MPASPLPIPDGDSSGVFSVVQVAAGAPIADVNVRLQVAHPFVGDLRATLTHLDSGRSVVLIDRPGLPDLPDGCPGADVSATFDDAAASLAQGWCSPVPPALGGRLRPAGTLGLFNGASSAGFWRLRVSDEIGGDAGAVAGWCLEVNAPPSTAPETTALTCNDDSECVVAIGEEFFIVADFVDPDGDATAWKLTARRDDGAILDAGQGVLDPPAGSGAIPLSFPGFGCPAGDCRETVYDFAFVVTDAAGQESFPAHVVVTVQASPG